MRARPLILTLEMSSTVSQAPIRTCRLPRVFPLYFPNPGELSEEYGPPDFVHMHSCLLKISAGSIALSEKCYCAGSQPTKALGERREHVMKTPFKLTGAPETSKITEEDSAEFVSNPRGLGLGFLYHHQLVRTPTPPAPHSKRSLTSATCNASFPPHCHPCR